MDANATNAAAAQALDIPLAYRLNQIDAVEVLVLRQQILDNFKIAYALKNNINPSSNGPQFTLITYKSFSLFPNGLPGFVWVAAITITSNNQPGGAAIVAKAKTQQYSIPTPGSDADLPTQVQYGGLTGTKIALLNLFAVTQAMLHNLEVSQQLDFAQNVGSNKVTFNMGEVVDGAN